MKGYRITLDGQFFDVEILSDPHAEQVQVRVNGQSYMVEVAALGEQVRETPAVVEPLVAPHSTSAPSPAAPPAATSSSGQLAAPLPGTVIRVLVQPGEKVSVGDELLVIEAMKMNNSIRSPRNGTVAELFVQVGETVNHGGALLSWAD